MRELSFNRTTFKERTRGWALGSLVFAKLHEAQKLCRDLRKMLQGAGRARRENAREGMGLTICIVRLTFLRPHAHPSLGTGPKRVRSERKVEKPRRALCAFGRSEHVAAIPIAGFELGGGPAWSPPVRVISPVKSIRRHGSGGRDRACTPHRTSLVVG